MDSRQTPLIVVFSTAYLPFTGGAELAIEEIAKRLPQFNFVILTARFTRTLPRRERHGHIFLRRLGIGVSLDKWLLPFLAFWAARKYCARGAARLFWGVMISQGTLGAYIAKKLYPQIPLVVTLQEGDSAHHIERGRAGLIYFFWRKVLGAADGVTAISAYLCGKAKKAGFRGKCVLFPNGVDENFVSLSLEKRDRTGIKRELGFDADAPIILSVSRLVPKNGLADLVKAFSLLQKDSIFAKLVLAGGGPEEHPLKNLARRLGCADDIVFLRNVPHEKALDYYLIADVFVRPSLSEGLGSAFLEAMGAGVPVVATPIGGIIDFIQADETGVFATPGDPDSIKDGIKRLLTDKALAEYVRARARELVVEKYLWVDISQAMGKFFADHIS